MVTSYLIPAFVNLSPLGWKSRLRRCFFFFLHLFPNDHHLLCSPLVAHVHPILHERTRPPRLLIFFLSLICSLAPERIPKFTKSRTRTLSYWYPRNRRPRHDPPRPLYIRRSRFVLYHRSIPCRPTTGSTDTSFVTLLRTIFRPAILVIFASPHIYPHHCSGPAPQIQLSELGSRRAVDRRSARRGSGP